MPNGTNHRHNGMLTVQPEASLQHSLEFIDDSALGCLPFFRFRRCQRRGAIHIRAAWAKIRELSESFQTDSKTIASRCTAEFNGFARLMLSVFSQTNRSFWSWTEQSSPVRSTALPPLP